MSSVSAVSLGLFAAVRLALGRADGAVLVPGDRETIVRSFWSIALCVPSVIGRLLMSWATTGVPVDAVHLIAREVIVFVLGWLVFVEVTYRLAPVIGKAERWGRFIAVWNWCNVIEGVLVFVGGIPGVLGAPSVVDEAFELITIGWALWLEWYATRLAFGVGRMTAVWLVVLDQSIGIMLASLALAGQSLSRVVRVADADQGQALGWRGGAGGGAVPGFQCRGDPFDGPVSLTDQLQRAGEVADLMMQEAAGLRHDFDDVVLAGDVQAVQGADGRFGLTGRRSERGEIVTTEQALCGRVHGGGIQWVGDVPDLAGHQRRTAAAVEDAEAIGAADGGEAGAPVVGHLCGRKDHNRMGLHVVVQSVPDGPGAVDGGQVDVGDLAFGVDSGVGSAGDDAGDGGAVVEVGGGLFEDRLDGQASDLALPPDERGAVVFKQQRPAGHGPITVPGGIGWPRRKSSAARAERPGSWTFGQPDGLAAARDGQGGVENGSGGS